MQRLWNNLVARFANASRATITAPLFALLDLLYKWALGTAPAFETDVVSVANVAGTYANGTSGVGATLVKASAGAWPTTDGVTARLGMFVLLTAQSTAYQNGLYTLTRVGSSSVAWQLTRYAGWDASAEMIAGSLFYVRQGTTYGGKVYAYTGSSSPTVGVTSLTFAQDSLLRSTIAATISAAQAFAVGTLRILNSAGTFYTTLASAATANRTATFPNKDITVAGTDDVATALSSAEAYTDSAFAAATGIVKRTVAITQAGDLAGLGAGVKTFSKNVGAILPANARLIGWTVGEGTFTAFDDATHGTYGLEIGTGGDADDVAQSSDVAAGTTVHHPTGLAGDIQAGIKGFPMAPRGGEQIVAKITSSVDLNTATAGAVTVDFFYFVLA